MKISQLRIFIFFSQQLFFVNFLNAQSNIEEDIIILKDGKEYIGQIIEQSPGKSIKIVESRNSDTLIFFVNQIDKLKKKKNVEEKQSSTDSLKKSTEIATKNIPNYSISNNSLIGNDLTVFSEDGYKFVIYINGEKHNESFSNHVTIENINHNRISVGVLFENSDKGVIEQIISLSHHNRKKRAFTNTYRITVNRKNKLVLTFFDYDIKKVLPPTINISK